jgi:GDP-L-fucose synthase
VFNRSTPIFVAGHRGMVGSAIARSLQRHGFHNLILRTREQTDLCDAAAVNRLFEATRPQLVFLAAARVGGILANDTYPADFIRENLLIQTHVIQAAHKARARRVLFLGSSCIYPRDAPNPIVESALLTGPLEPTNRAYALAKIAGIEMCWSYNRQYDRSANGSADSPADGPDDSSADGPDDSSADGSADRSANGPVDGSSGNRPTSFLAAMPTNLYGPGDNYHSSQSHVIPGLIRRFHEAKQAGLQEVMVWGSGMPRREFMHADDMAEACVRLMLLEETRWRPLTASDRNHGDAPLVNIGTGEDLTIAELARLIAAVVGYQGRIAFDASKPDGTLRKLMSSDKLYRLVGRQARPLVQGLAQAYVDFLEHPANGSTTP